MIIIGNIIIKIFTIIITFSIFIQWGGSMVLKLFLIQKRNSAAAAQFNLIRQRLSSANNLK